VRNQSDLAAVASKRYCSGVTKLLRGAASRNRAGKLGTLATSGGVNLRPKLSIAFSSVVSLFAVEADFPAASRLAR